MDNFTFFWLNSEFSGGLRPEQASALTGLVDRADTRTRSPLSQRLPVGAQSPFSSPRASPIPSRRSPSPRRFDVGFASAVDNICEQAHTIADQDRQKRYGMKTPRRGSTSLVQHSRSPSPSITADSPPMSNRAHRRLPMAPSSNFPRSSASDTRVPKLNIPVSATSSVAAASPLPKHQRHAPPPGRLGRSEPYSPTERNNLNKSSDPSRSSTLPGDHRTSSYPRDDSNWGSNKRGRDSRSLPKPSPRQSSRSPDPQAAERDRQDHRFMAASQQEGSRTRGSRSRGGILPNGFKQKGRKPDKYEMRSDSQTALQEDSDEDWC
ncbi:serine/arginine repetitive matrix protein 1-like [Physella acuta]|uniref:serine/arginine repetitive matrix protein 1-like n=1 Tax=Physella acuta TaxID=109671 RepID=UPI0027DD62CF|nr:serine/arginine repetitive matrix protein 1-like [Physella acuta]